MKTEFINDLLEDFESEVETIDNQIAEYEERQSTAPCEWRARLIEMEKNRKEVYQDLIAFVRNKYWK